MYWKCRVVILYSIKIEVKEFNMLVIILQIYYHITNDNQQFINNKKKKTI